MDTELTDENDLADTIYANLSTIWRYGMTVQQMEALMRVNVDLLMTTLGRLDKARIIRWRQSGDDGDRWLVLPMVYL